MDLSSTMRFVMSCAEVETDVTGMEKMYPEHLFLGFLKLAEITPDQIFSAEVNRRQAEEDIRKVNYIFQVANIRPGFGREKLRYILCDEKTKKDEKSLVPELLNKASNTGKQELSATDVLEVLIQEPTPILRSVFALDGDHPLREKEKEASETPSPRKNMPYLQELTGRIRNMEQGLLDTIFGQDHAVHAFAEGIFNAEVLAGADEKRKSPRAIFVFAGQPGIGKTFLAEQAAEALSIPFKRFDMSGYSDHQAQAGLIGFAPSYTDAREGQLTGFVLNHPHSILLFDEIEKAHLNTIQLFLQILDAGTLHDDFWDKTASFKDTILIFTTNAGKQLYEGEDRINSAGFSRATILNALKNDTHPQTGIPFFPPTICSRLATGHLILFNQLQTHDLEKISAEEWRRSCTLFEKQYRIRVEADPLLPTALLLAEGGLADARTLKAQTGWFFRNEMFKLLTSWDRQFKVPLKNIDTISFQLSTDGLPSAVKQLFEYPSKPEILLFGEVSLAETLKNILPDVTPHPASDTQEALSILVKREIDVVFLAIFPPGETTHTIPLYKTRDFFNLIRKRAPDMPFYLLTPGRNRTDPELISAFIRAGARGTISLPEDKPEAFAKEIVKIIRQAHRQNTTAVFAAQHKTLSFETSTTLSSNKKQAVIHVNELRIRKTFQAENNNALLDRIEKPETKFDDIVGVSYAKEKLSLFIDCLKNPRKCAALGIYPPKGILLYGPPGTGKTLLAKAMAGEADAIFIPVSANALVANSHTNEPDTIRELFKKAERYAPAILFIDEIDAIGSSKPGRSEEIALKRLLAEMKRFTVDPKRPVVVVAATTHGIEENTGETKVINETLVRRFDLKILIYLPDENDREDYLRKILDKRKNQQATEKYIKYLANRSMDFSLADLEQVLDLSYRLASQKNVPVDDSLLEEAFLSSHPGERKYWDDEFWRD